MQIKQSYTAKGVEKLLRVVPLQIACELCAPHLLPCMLPKWLEALAVAVPAGAARCEVLHEPEYWHFQQGNTAVHFQVLY